MRLDHNMGEIDQLFQGLTLSMGDGSRTPTRHVAKDFNPLSHIFKCSSRSNHDVSEPEVYCDVTAGDAPPIDMQALSDALDSVALSSATPKTTTTSQTSHPSNTEHPQNDDACSSAVKASTAAPPSESGDSCSDRTSEASAATSSPSYHSAQNASDDVTSDGSDDECFQDCFDSPGGVSTDKRLHPEKIFIFGWRRNTLTNKRHTCLNEVFVDLSGRRRARLTWMSCERWSRRPTCHRCATRTFTTGATRLCARPSRHVTGESPLYHQHHNSG